MSVSLQSNKVGELFLDLIVLLFLYNSLSLAKDDVQKH